MRVAAFVSEPDRMGAMASFFPSNSTARRWLYELLHLWSGAQGITAFNIGYAPVSADILADSRFADEAHQIELYARLLETGGLLRAAPSPRRILEVGVGCGGGLRYAGSRLSGTEVVGVDSARMGVFMTRRLGLTARVASANHLLFPDGHFDAMLCVDSFSIFPRLAFLHEAHRVLRADGLVLIGDYLVQAPGEIRGELGTTAEAGGFAVERFVDETKGVLAALEADDARKDRIMAKVPKPLRALLSETLAMPGTERRRNWLEGKTCYYMAVLRKTDAPSYKAV